jgi:cyclopropane fatty-acyl-phospholipid synthase-like methyltransferase
MTTPKETALENRATEGARMFSPSTARNRDAIRDVFIKTMPHEGRILEIGGGTGEHAVHIAGALPDVEWRTGDPDETARRSIAAWISHADLPNLAGPHAIDVTQDDWGVEDLAPFAGLVSVNMIHIAPFAAAEGLFAGAGRLLGENGKLFLYGPFARNGAHTAPSNEAFDATLKARDPRWGVRDLEREIVPLARNHALSLDALVEMPANNFTAVFRKG